jgi:pentatricopeptide repeat protein
MLDKASELFEEMPSNDVEWNVYSFTALINAYGRNGQYEASLHLLARMKRERVTPNLITYNTVINACAKGGLDWEGLLGLFAQMRHEGIQPDIITYNTLLSACSRSNPFLYIRLITFCFFLLLWCEYGVIFCNTPLFSFLFHNSSRSGLDCGGS